MSAALAANQAFVTATDLAAYATREDAPVTGSYRGLTLATSQPPHGGPTLIAILNILEGYDLATMTHNSPEHIYLVAMAMKAAFPDPNPHPGAPAIRQAPLASMP